MPPIFGILKNDKQPPDREMIRRMEAAATYIKPRQLSSLDLPAIWITAAMRKNSRDTVTGNVIHTQGNLVIAADASLYNKKELVYRLGNNISVPATGDAKLILLAYEKWGTRCLEQLYGDFAFVIFDTQSGEIFCGRDPMGVRPFFYTIQGNSFIFSSELRMVLGACKNAPELNEEYFLDSLITVKTEKSKSPFDTIMRLPPAYYLTGRGGQVSVTQYWQPDARASIDLDNEDEYIEMFRELLLNAVNMRCNGVASLGSELSGGLDSSAVTGIAVEYAAGENMPFSAFSNIFPAGTGIEFKDEMEFISSMLAHKTMNWVGVDRLNQTLPGLFRHTLDIQGCFVQQNFNIFNKGIYEAAEQQGTHVLLSGFGGDELVSARISLPWNELVRDRKWQVLRDEIYYNGFTPRSLLKPGLIGARYLYSRIRKPSGRTGVFTPQLLERRLSNLPLIPAFAEKHKLAARFREKYTFPYQEKLSFRQLLRIDKEHLPQRMEYCYTAAAQYGIEYRYPLLDVNLVLAGLAFPPWLKQHHGTNRYLFRQVIKDFVPEVIRKRDDKSGTTIPHIYYSLLNEKNNILDLVNSCSASEYLNQVFDLSRFPAWYEMLVKRDREDMNYMMPGAFYGYLMMLMYFRGE
jgi:asparagine synthase (glutamine-hydrolysing)